MCARAEAAAAGGRGRVEGILVVLLALLHQLCVLAAAHRSKPTKLRLLSQQRIGENRTNGAHSANTERVDDDGKSNIKAIRNRNSHAAIIAAMSSSSYAYPPCMAACTARSESACTNTQARASEHARARAAVHSTLQKRSAKGARARAVAMPCDATECDAVRCDGAVGHRWLR
jgi:hypothetical protein